MLTRKDLSALMQKLQRELDVDPVDECDKELKLKIIRHLRGLLGALEDWFKAKRF